MNTCDLQIYELIHNYLNDGWYKLTHIFLNKKKEVRDDVDRDTLILLAHLREYIVRKTFRCKNITNKVVFINFGSNNITSDYDINLVGIDSPNVMFEMFTDFLHKYKTTLPLSFDCNIYTCGLLEYKKIDSNNIIPYNLNNFNKSNVDYDRYKNLSFMTLEPKTKEDKKICLIYAFIKLLNYNFKDTDRLRIYFKEAVKMKKKLYKIEHSYKKIHKKVVHDLIKIDKSDYYHKSLSRSHKMNIKHEFLHKLEELYTKHYLQKKYVTILFDKLYNNKNDYKEYSIMELLCIGKYFSIESYYTQCTFNVVVLELQANLELGLNATNYICAIIENLGDLLDKITDSNFNLITIVKYSKYFYRIEYSLEKAGISDKNKSKLILDNIIVYRDKLDIINELDDKILELLLYNKGISKEDYINKILNYYLNLIKDNI